MNKDQIEMAEKKVKELKKYHRDNEAIRYFIEKLADSHYLNLQTSNQTDMDFGAKETYDLVGEELVEILQMKLKNREEYLESLEAIDLIL